MSFLPVGHTHEDIDRRFSRVSVHLKHRTTATIADLHEALCDSQHGIIKPFVARVTGMNKFSGALKDQNLVVSQVDSMLTFRRFTFEVDLTGGNQQRVNCMAANNMREKRDEWTKLDRKEGYVGVFLLKVPNMTACSPLKAKPFSEKDRCV